MTRYTLDVLDSRFTVHAFAVGLLSFVAHSPVFTGRDFAGAITLEDTVESLRLEMTVPADALELTGGASAARSS
jgi:hypothetical protein